MADSNDYRTYYGQSGSRPTSSQAATGRYEGYSSQPTPGQAQHLPRRVPSYNAGDDSQLLMSPRATSAQTTESTARHWMQKGGYGRSGTQGGYHVAPGGYEDEREPSLFARTPSEQAHVSPTRASSQTSSVGYGYQYPASSNQLAYNPQQYGLPQSQTQPNLSYKPPSYHSPTSNGPYTNTGSHHQPYNPAAYQQSAGASLNSPVLARRPSEATHYAPAPPTPQSYGFSSQYQQPPMPPPRGTDHPYGSRAAGYGPSPTSPGRSTSTTGSTIYQAMPSPTMPNYPSASPSSAAYLPSSASRPSFPVALGIGSEPPFSPTSTSVGSNTYDEQPPRPPAHQFQSSGTYGSRPSIPYSASARTLPNPPMLPDLPSLPPRRTETLNRHPQARPLPGPPIDTEPDWTRLPDNTGQVPNDELMRELETAVMDTQATFARHNNARSALSNASQTERLTPDEQHTHTNSNISEVQINYSAYSADSDAEAETGLAMLRMAEEEEQARQERERMKGRSRRLTNASATSARSFGSQASGRGPSPQQSSPRATFSQGPSPLPYSANDDFVGHDLALYEGGYQGNLHYGDEPSYTSDEYPGAQMNGSLGRHHDSFRSSHQSNEEQSEYHEEYEHPAIAYEYANRLHNFSSNARVDALGTGGLSAPGHYDRRMSFDYGEDTEGPYDQQQAEDQSGDDSPYNDAPAELFFHPGMRPLPPAPVEAAGQTDLYSHLMPAGTYRPPDEDQTQEYDQYRHPSSVAASVNSYGEQLLIPSQVPRSSSLSAPSGPRTDAPIRSKTDADRAKYKQQQEYLWQLQNKELPRIDPAEAAAHAPLDLPAIPAARRKKFNPAKLSTEQFKKCTEPWALSAVLTWIKDLSQDETDLRQHAIVDAIVALFTHKVPTMNIADAETLAARVVTGMLDEGALVKDEEWVKFGHGQISGVLFQITGTGCYSSRLHEQEVHIQDTDVLGRCYSHHCMRTLRKVNLRAQMMAPQKKIEDWVTFYQVPKEVWETYPKKEIDRQNNLHEIVTTEDAYIGQLDVLRELYRDQLAQMNPPIIPAKRLEKFLTEVFGKVDAVKRVNEDFLLAQLKYRQKEQGPFIAGFSDIFREWIRKAKNVYIDYAATFPHANYFVRRESERNPQFRAFLNQVREHKLSNRLSWDTFLKAPITRIQRYTLLLATVHKNMAKDSEEKTNLAQAIEEIKVVALECDNKVGEQSRQTDLMDLASKLQLRPEMKKEVELHLDHLGREIIFRGDLQRPGTRTRFLVDTHAILFDHYLVLAKSVTARDARSAKYERYDVSKLPIPMDLLALESTNDDPVVKSSVRGVATITPAQGAAIPSANAAGVTANGGGVSLDTKDDKILYPFRIKHLGKTGTYTLYAFSASSRLEWCQKIIEAKTKHAAALFSQNAEPFRLRVLADTAFAYSDQSHGSKSVMIQGTPLHRAIVEVDKKYQGEGRPPPVGRTVVNCATVFQQPPGRMMCAIGTDFGVYMSDLSNPRGWHRAIPIMRVTQIAVFEDFNLFLLIADRSLIAYHLDVVCPASGIPSKAKDSARRAPQKLSGNREVGFFAAGRMKDRYLVLYKKRDGLSSTFKVLEPILQKSSSNRAGIFQSRRSQTEFFREYDEFYIPAESYGINMFHSSLAISTQRGIEVLTLDKKQSWSVPDFRSAIADATDTLHSIAQRIKDLRPLGMFRLSKIEFLVAYQECAVYVNKHGDVSRGVVMEFVGSAHTACLYGAFLILFNDDFIEVRNAENGRLRQVIPGHNVVCLDDGNKTSGITGTADADNMSGSANGVSTSPGNTVKICMQHPQYERSQIVLELIENEGQKE
ncbi:Uncharacterized protein PECH_003857 [Penicillium ucsense]|uniref:Rho guanyl nucleotide exchange factor n=1 Tax=Penicillium ucsense TaxID=2839758 RepID=A0A8J8WK78_9EURO|nr:Uncharacterized protein PECM_005624 [Penicillium ucsense]KAF7737405.1 Uncharacterized protein PECH_003857 [Penicillium ucsense]